MSAAATRDDLAAVVTALTESAAEQRKWQAEYIALAVAADSVEARTVWNRNAAMAQGTALAFEISADMISKYVSVDHGYTRVVNGETT